MTNIITAYCACTICCGPNAKGITASGKPPIEGRTIAGPRAVPLGTKVIINNHTYTVEDRTTLKYDGRWDIFMRSHKAARQFGIQTNKQVILLNK